MHVQVAGFGDGEVPPAIVAALAKTMIFDNRITSIADNCDIVSGVYEWSQKVVEEKQSMKRELGARLRQRVF